MSAWSLVPSLRSLVDEFNELAPGRDHASDGVVADAAHYAGGTSDHIPDEEVAALRDRDPDDLNEVHAVDVDDDLRRPGLSMAMCCGIIATRHRDGRDDRLQYIIYNRLIISRSWGWSEWRAYSGDSPHTEHAHFSNRYTDAAERDTRPWGLLEAFDVDEATCRKIIREELAAALNLNGLKDGRTIGGTTNWVGATVPGALSRIEQGVGQVLDRLSPPTSEG